MPCALSSTPLIAPDQVQYLRYRNGTLRGQCQSTACVQVNWGSFTHTVSAQAWNERSFLSHPEKANILHGEALAQAEAFFTVKCQEDMALRATVPSTPIYPRPR